MNSTRYLAKYEEAGGVFTALEGVEREKAIEKNAYLVKHDLPYANETHPVSPALQMSKITPILLGPAGLLLLLLLFGNAYHIGEGAADIIDVKDAAPSQTEAVACEVCRFANCDGFLFGFHSDWRMGDSEYFRRNIQ